MEYLKTHGPTTVEALAEALQLTPVTVRHHLDILRAEAMVSEPLVRHRAGPGRPQYVFELTDRAALEFPNNYQELTNKVLEAVKAGGAARPINVLFEDVAHRLTAETPATTPGETFEERLARAVEFLNQRGYNAHWEKSAAGYELHTCHCPYEALTANHPELCTMDNALLHNLLGVAPECLGRMAEGAGSCSFLIRG